jgi:hypothetical protein
MTGLGGMRRRSNRIPLQRFLPPGEQVLRPAACVLVGAAAHLSNCADRRAVDFLRSPERMARHCLPKATSTPAHILSKSPFVTPRCDLTARRKMRCSQQMLKCSDASSHVIDRLCGLVVRVLGYRSGDPGSIPGTTKKKSNGSGTGSTQPREYN